VNPPEYKAALFRKMLFLLTKRVFLYGFSPEFGALPAARSIRWGGGGFIFDVPLCGASYSHSETSITGSESLRKWWCQATSNSDFKKTLRWLPPNRKKRGGGGFGSHEGLFFQCPRLHRSLGSHLCQPKKWGEGSSKCD
jgi:hypothetical protein